MGAMQGSPRWNGEQETEKMRGWLLRGESLFPGTMRKILLGASGSGIA
jgi:hypothetical protein